MTKACGALGVLLSAVLIGCGGGLDDDPTKASVSGTVTVDGKPLQGGSLLFQPSDGRAPTTLPLDDSGNFSGEVNVGENVIVVEPAGGGHGGAAPSAVPGLNKSAQSAAADNPLKLSVPGGGKSGVKVEVGATPSVS